VRGLKSYCPIEEFLARDSFVPEERRASVEHSGLWPALASQPELATETDVGIALFFNTQRNLIAEAQERIEYGPEIALALAGADHHRGGEFHETSFPMCQPAQNGQR
jgi:hypothetical protein